MYFKLALRVNKLLTHLNCQVLNRFCKMNSIFITWPTKYKTRCFICFRNSQYLTSKLIFAMVYILTYPVLQIRNTKLSNRHYTLFPAVRNISASRSLLSVGFMEMKWQLILDLKALEEHPEIKCTFFCQENEENHSGCGSRPRCANSFGQHIGPPP